MVRDNDRFAAIAKDFAKVFAEIRGKMFVLRIVRTPCHVWEVESYALLKFQPPTTLGEPQNVEKMIRKKRDLFWSRKLVVRRFWSVITMVCRRFSYAYEFRTRTNFIRVRNSYAYEIHTRNYEKRRRTVVITDQNRRKTHFRD